MYYFFELWTIKQTRNEMFSSYEETLIWDSLHSEKLSYPRHISLKLQCLCTIDDSIRRITKAVKSTYLVLPH